MHVSIDTNMTFRLRLGRGSPEVFDELSELVDCVVKHCETLPKYLMSVFIQHCEMDVLINKEVVYTMTVSEAMAAIVLWDETCEANPSLLTNPQRRNLQFGTFILSYRFSLLHTIPPLPMEKQSGKRKPQLKLVKS